METIYKNELKRNDQRGIFVAPRCHLVAYDPRNQLKIGTLSNQIPFRFRVQFSKDVPNKTFFMLSDEAMMPNLDSIRAINRSMASVTQQLTYYF